MVTRFGRLCCAVRCDPLQLCQNSIVLLLDRPLYSERAGKVASCRANIYSIFLHCEVLKKIKILQPYLTSCKPHNHKQFGKKWMNYYYVLWSNNLHPEFRAIRAKKDSSCRITTRSELQKSSCLWCTSFALLSLSFSPHLKVWRWRRPLLFTSLERTFWMGDGGIFRERLGFGNTSLLEHEIFFVFYQKHILKQWNIELE